MFLCFLKIERRRKGDSEMIFKEQFTMQLKDIGKENYMKNRAILEEFEKASPEVKKFFGNVAQVRELAQTKTDIVNSVTKGQFLKQYEVIVNREREQKLLPQNMKDFTKKLVEKMDIKQIGE